MATIHIAGDYYDQSEVLLFSYDFYRDDLGSGGWGFHNGGVTFAVGNNGAVLYGTSFDDTYNLGSNNLGGNYFLEAGGLGNDAYIINDANTFAVEFAGEGTDSVLSSVTYSLDTVPYYGASGAFVEKLYLTGAANINGTGNALDNYMEGNSGNNIMSGGDGNDTIKGNGGNDDLYGGIGNDQLFGGTGTNRLYGGIGDDTYVLDAYDQVFENAGEGTDSVISLVANYTLAANVEKLYLGGTVAAGNGNSLDNRIVGNSANNVINGYGGADVMEGAAGDDAYFVDNAGDFIVELLGNGTDTVFSTLNWTLGGNIEKLILTGTASSGTGNGLDNTLYANNAVGSTLNGMDGNDRLEGRALADTLIGGNGNDVLIGGAAGDTYVFGLGSGADTIVGFERHSNGGFDVIDLSAYGTTFGAVIAGATDFATYTVLHLGGGNDITVQGATTATLLTSDFIF